MVTATRTSAQATFDLSSLKDFTSKITSKKTLNKILEETKIYMKNSTKEKIRKGYVKGPKTLAPLTKKLRRKGSSTVLNDTGALRRSINAITSGRGINKYIVVGSPLIYARLQNEGGTITPKTAKKLYLPASKKTKQLSNLYGVKEALTRLKKEGWYIWHTNRAVLGVSPTNKKRIKGSSQQRKKLSSKYQQLLFIKKSSVHIPKREYLYVSKRDERIITSLVVKTWEKEAT